MNKKIKCSFNVRGFFNDARQIFPLHEKSSEYKKKFKIDKNIEVIEKSIVIIDKKPVVKVLAVIQVKKKKKITWSMQFLKSVEWKDLRKKFFEASSKVCVYCGAKENLQVDHIKPKSKYTELALTWTNLQILCWPCNRKKAAKC